jgi:hypothetical protein
MVLFFDAQLFNTQKTTLCKNNLLILKKGRYQEKQRIISISTQPLLKKDCKTGIVLDCSF